MAAGASMRCFWGLCERSLRTPIVQPSVQPPSLAIVATVKASPSPVPCSSSWSKLSGNRPSRARLSRIEICPSLALRRGDTEPASACASASLSEARLDGGRRVSAVGQEAWEGMGDRGEGDSDEPSDSDGGETPSASARDRRKERQARRMLNLEERRLVALDEPDSKIAKAPNRTLTEEEFVNFRNVGHLRDRGPQWYILNVPSGEARAMERIGEGMARFFPDVEFEMFLPQVPSTRVTSMGKLTSIPERLQPGTLFLRVDLTTDVHDFLRATPGVLGFFGRRVAKTRRVLVAPMPVEDAEVEAVRTKVREGEAAYERFKVQFEREMGEIAAGERPPIVRKGMKVRVIRGPFKNCEGKVVKVLEDRTKVSLQLKLFEEAQVVEIEVNDLRLPRAVVAKAAAAQSPP